MPNGDRQNGCHVRVVPSRMHEGRSVNARIRARKWRFIYVYCTHTGSRQPIRYSPGNFGGAVDSAIAHQGTPPPKLTTRNHMRVRGRMRTWMRSDADEGLAAGAAGAWSCVRWRSLPVEEDVALAVGLGSFKASTSLQSHTAIQSPLVAPSCLYPENTGTYVYMRLPMW